MQYFLFLFGSLLLGALGVEVQNKARAHNQSIGFWQRRFSNLEERQQQLSNDVTRSIEGLKTEAALFEATNTIMEIRKATEELGERHNADVEKLRAELEKVSQECLQSKTALLSVTNTLLEMRQAMEKLGQQHSADVLKLNAKLEKNSMGRAQDTGALTNATKMILEMRQAMEEELKGHKADVKKLNAKLEENSKERVQDTGALTNATKIILEMRQAMEEERKGHKADVEKLNAEHSITTSILQELQYNSKQLNEQYGSPYEATANKQAPLPRSCEAVMETTNVTGVYAIFAPEYGPNPFDVYCENDARYGRGWTVVSRSEHNTRVDFNRNWSEYKKGFGNLTGNFFIGLDTLHALTSGNKTHSLLIRLKQYPYSRAKYQLRSPFAVGDEQSGFEIRGYTALQHSPIKFTTKDVDNDQWPLGNCAIDRSAGGWFTNCDKSILGPKLAWIVRMYSAEMLIRPMQ